MRTRLALSLSLLILVLPGGAAAAPGAEQISFYLGLERPERAARAAFMAVQQPGSASYRSFLTVGEVARRYGASAATARRLRQVAAISAAERAARRPPLGPVNGLLYSLGPGALFDIESGNNGYDRRVAARVAGPGYDLASGLGAPRFDRIAAALPPPAGGD